MKSATKNFATGIAAIIGLTGFAYLLLLFGEFEEWSSTRYTIQIEANQAVGLRSGSPVTLAGVPIGEVAAVEVVIDSNHPARITAKIKGDVDIPDGVVASVTTSLIGATSQLNFSIPLDYKPGGSTLPRDGKAIVQAHFENLQDIVLKKVDVGLADFTKTMKSAQDWLGDEQMRNDFKSAASNANQLMTEAHAQLLGVEKTMAEFRGDANLVVNKLIPALDQLTTTLAEVQLLAKTARTGSGTVGQLMSNADLYQSLVDSADRLKFALGELELYMQKVRADGIDLKLK